MAITGFSMSERFTRWQLLANNLKEAGVTNLVDDELVQLDSLLVEARGLLERQEQARAQARAIRKQLVDIAQRGDSVRSRMGAVLQGKIGFTSQELIRYGFTPRRVPRRRPKPKQPEGEQQTPPAGKAASTGASS